MIFVLYANQCKPRFGYILPTLHPGYGQINADDKRWFFFFLYVRCRLVFLNQNFCWDV